MITAPTEALTRRINSRGILIDQDHCRNQIAAVTAARETLLLEMHDITGLPNPNAPIPLRTWVNKMGVDLPNMQAATIREALPGIDDVDVARVLNIRLVVAKSPISKYQAALNRVSADGRLLGMLLYYGAVKTGRWSSAGGVNMQNLPRPLHPSQLAPKGTPERVIQDAADAIRNMVIAAKDKHLAVSDLAGIEARVLAWLAGEIKALEAYARGEDMYVKTYAEVTGTRIEDSTKVTRFIGKVIVLAMGYAGGIGAFMQFAAVYNLDLSILYDIIWPLTSQHHSKARWMLKYHRKFSKRHLKVLAKKYGEDKVEEIVLACECIKLGWRESNPNIAAFWKDLEDAWGDAFANPGKTFTAGMVAMTYGKANTGPVMRMTLPSGTHIYHHSPASTNAEEKLMMAIERARKKKVKDLTDQQTELLDAVAEVVPGADFMDTEELRREITYDIAEVIADTAGMKFGRGVTYMAQDSVTKQWRRTGTYGGSLSESCLTGETKVLTSIGWIRLDKITLSHRIWDGVAFVEHEGLIDQGVNNVIEMDGIRGTRDHEILTQKGWTPLERVDGSIRREARLPYFHEVCRERWSSWVLGGGLCLRRESSGAQVGDTREDERNVVMWMPNQQASKRSENSSWDVFTSGVRCLARTDRQMRVTFSSFVSSLRRTRHNTVRQVGRLREILGGHGADLQNWPFFGSDKQQRSIFARELSLGNRSTAGEQYSSKPYRRNTEGAHDCRTGVKRIRGRQHNNPISVRQRVAGHRRGDNTSELREQVYDIRNCGPRNRFVIRSNEGYPAVAHNCAQRVSRDVLAYNAVAVEDAGYEIDLMVHDEVITETKDGSIEELNSLLATVPPWAQGLPLAAAGYITEKGGFYYKED